MYHYLEALCFSKPSETLLCRLFAVSVGSQSTWHTSSVCVLVSQLLRNTELRLVSVSQSWDHCLANAAVSFICDMEEGKSRDGSFLGCFLLSCYIFSFGNFSQLGGVCPMVVWEYRHELCTHEWESLFSENFSCLHVAFADQPCAEGLVMSLTSLVLVGWACVLSQPLHLLAFIEIPASKSPLQTKNAQLMSISFLYTIMIAINFLKPVLVRLCFSE